MPDDKNILSYFTYLEPQDQGQRTLAVPPRVVLVQRVHQVHQVIQFADVNRDWFPIQILSLGASQSVFAIQTANMDMFAKTKDVLKNQIHATLPHVDQAQHALQIVSEILFVGKYRF